MSRIKVLFLLLVFSLSVNINHVLADGIDTIRVVDMETGFEDNLDELLNLWYVQQALQVEYSDSLFYLDDESSLPDFSDSVYISRLQSLPFVMELTYNRIVKNFIDLYAKQRRDKVRIMLALTEYYFPMFEEVFDRYGIPDEMKYLSVIESALNPRAVSRAGATGLWQFMPYTGKSYGLTINSLVDDRRDVVKSTEAAARFLKDLHNIYKDWILVIAAYNCGPGNVNKAIRRAGGKRNYWDIYYFLPRETRGYVPAFIAASYVFNFKAEHNLYPARLSFDYLTDTIHIHQKLHLKQVAEVLEIPIEQLRDLNPQFRQEIIPGDGKPYHLRIPQMQAMRFIELQDSILNYKKDEFFNNERYIVSPTTAASRSSNPVLPSDKYTKLLYTVKSGDNLGFIAGWYNVRITDIRYWNNIRQNLIRTGQKLVVYVPNERADRYREVNNLSFEEKQSRAGLPSSIAVTVKPVEPTNNTPASAGSNEYIYYTVKQGDTLWDIAKKYPGVSDTDIAQLNNIRSGDKIIPGQVIRIRRSG